MTTGLITEQYNFSFAFLDISLLCNIFLFAKKTLFPRSFLSFISSSILLSVFTLDPRYLNDQTCSISLFSIFMAFNWSCRLEHLRYFVLCAFTVRSYFRENSKNWVCKFLDKFVTPCKEKLFTGVCRKEIVIRLLSI